MEFEEICRGASKGILINTKDPIESGDIFHNPVSSTLASKCTMANLKTAKVLSRRDNDWGYSIHLVDIIPKLF